MSKARLIITAVVLEGRTQAEVARTYRVSKGWVSKLVARYRAEGDAAFTPRSRRPHSSPTALPLSTVELIIQLRRSLAEQGHDHGPDTIAWHLRQHHNLTVSPATISRHLTRAGLVAPQPAKRPKSSYIRFEAALPNECWQSDFTHYRLADGSDTQILTFLDDATRYAISVTAHRAMTTPIIVTAFRTAIATHGAPAATLTDNGMVYTVKHSGWGRRGGRNAFETELRERGIAQKNGSPSHPQTQGKVERFQQTLKNWLRAQHPQPTTIEDLQRLLDTFADDYNHHRPHRSLPHRATPAARYATLPKDSPATGARTDDAHARVRHDRIDKTGTVTLRVNGRLHHIGVGRTHTGTHVLLLTDDLDVRIVNATTGELLRELTIDTTRDYQPKNKKPSNP